MQPQDKAIVLPPLNKEEVMFQIEILYDFIEDDVQDKDAYVARKISENFKIPIEEARKLVEDYKLSMNK